MNATEVIVNMYNGSVTDYPFDRHNADLWFYFSVKPPKAPEKVDSSKTTEENPADETKTEAAVMETEVEVPITVDFSGAIAGYKMTATKSKESDDTFVDINMEISRSPTVIFFSAFVILLMWGLSFAVMFMMLSVVLRGRKAELGMFSFITALIFAFAAVRNSQPAVPPIGTLSDYLSFFWAEVILALCLLITIFTWLLRPAAK